MLAKACHLVAQLRKGLGRERERNSATGGKLTKRAASKRVGRRCGVANSQD
jgi:hypothetical protein